MFLFGVVVFAVSSAAIGLAPDQGWLIAGRAIQGVGAAFMMPATLSIITVAFPPHERGKAIGTWAGVSALALAIGPVVGGALTEHVSWRAIFFLNLPVAVGAVAVTLFAARESRDETHRALDRLARHRDALRRAHGARPRPDRGQLVGLGLARDRSACSLTAAVGLVELRRSSSRASREPMVDFSLFRSRTSSARTWSRFIVSFSMLAVFFFIALYMQNILGYSAARGGRPLPALDPDDRADRAAGRAAGGPDRPAPADVAGLALTTVSLFTPDAHRPPHRLRPAAPRLHDAWASAWRSMMSPMSTAAMNAVPAQKAGVGSGILSMSRMVGGTFGVAALGALFQHIAPRRHRRTRSPAPA